MLSTSQLIAGVPGVSNTTLKGLTNVGGTNLLTGEIAKFSIISKGVSDVSDWTEPPAGLSELQILFEQQHDCFLAGITRVFSSLNTWDFVYLSWNNLENECLNKSMSALETFSNMFAAVHILHILLQCHPSEIYVNNNQPQCPEHHFKNTSTLHLSS